MREWNFSPERPVTLTIAADARLHPTDYINDQIWELNLGNSEPPALSLQTTFGLRAPLCRIFPRFIYKGQVVSNPAEFHRSVNIHQYYPNYLNLSFKPFSWLNVVLEYWVPDSHAVACRGRLVNTSHDTCQVQIEWAGLLIPGDEGHIMAAAEMGLTTVLVGKTADLSPLLFVLSGAHSGKSPYPSLELSYTLNPRAEQTMLWCHAALSDTSASFEHARSVLEMHWDHQVALSARFNSGLLEIITGNHEWDTVFYLSQTVFRQLLISPDSSGGTASGVYTRSPDRGYSILKDGTDYDHLWNGLTLYDIFFISNFLLPSEPGVLKQLLQNFIDSRTSTGYIDCKPGPAGQRSQLLATPMLARLVWEYYLYTQDIEFLRLSYPGLLAFFLSWFDDTHDSDHDSIPEWDHVIQTGFEDHPLFSIHREGSEGLDLHCVEGPDLCAYLVQEGQSLLSIARAIANTDMILRLESLCLDLHAGVEQSWDDAAACYQYRDRDTHVCSQNILLGKRSGPGLIEIHQEFEPPVRPIIHIFTTKEGTRPIQIYLHGTTETGTHRVDHVTAADIRWFHGQGTYTSKSVYRVIEQVECSGIPPADEVVVHTLGLKMLDQSLLVPLWAHLPTADKAKILINLTILNKKKFLGMYGLKSWVNDPQSEPTRQDQPLVNLPAVAMLLEGLCHYGQRKKAAELFTRVMKAVLASIKQDLAFHQYYQADTGKPVGTANYLTGLIPDRTFLMVAGLKIYSPQRVEILGSNPFPWPVTVKYRGLTVVHQEKKTLVIFPDGQNITVDNRQPQVVSTGTPL